MKENQIFKLGVDIESYEGPKNSQNPNILNLAEKYNLRPGEILSILSGFSININLEDGGVYQHKGTIDNNEVFSNLPPIIPLEKPQKNKVIQFNTLT